MTNCPKRKNGFGLVEIIVGSALISATLFALLLSSGDNGADVSERSGRTYDYSNG